MKKAIHVEKILFPKDHLSKRDLLDYYVKISKKMLPFLKNRPLTLHRFPRGISHEGFIQKNISGSLLDVIPTVKVKTLSGSISMPICSSLKVLKELISLDTVAFHTPLSQTDHLNEADKIIFDLDPSSKDFEKVRKIAFLLRELLEEKLHLRTSIMLTGSKGLHVIIFLKSPCPFDETKAFAKNVATYMASEYSKLCTTALRKASRGQKVFMDYLRNAKGQTSVCPYSVRPLEHGPIAMPISWNELEKKSTHPKMYTLKNIHGFFVQKKNRWNIINVSHLKLHRAKKIMRCLMNK